MTPNGGTYKGGVVIYRVGCELDWHSYNVQCVYIDAICTVFCVYICDHVGFPL